MFLKAMYGLRDAGASFDRKVLDVMNFMGVTGQIQHLCRIQEGDEHVDQVGATSFSAVGGRFATHSETIRKKHVLVKTTAVLGPNAEMGDVQEAIHLKTDC